MVGATDGDIQEARFEGAGIDPDARAGSPGAPWREVVRQWLRGFGQWSNS